MEQCNAIELIQLSLLSDTPRTELLTYPVREELLHIRPIHPPHPPTA